jgi:putative ABC transport system permease protein
MFWRILGQLFSASRGRLAVALLALASGAAVTTALINLNMDAERKVSSEFRTFGPNIVILPSHKAADDAERELTSSRIRGGEFLDRLSQIETPQAPSGDPGSAPLMGDDVVDRLLSVPDTAGAIAAPYLYAVANVSQGASTNQVIVAGTWLDRMAQLAPWWRINGDAVSDRADITHCLVGQKAAKQLGLAPGSRVELRYADQISKQSVVLIVSGVIESGSQEDSQIIANLPVVMQLVHISSLKNHVGVVQAILPGTPTEISHAIAKISAALPDVEVRPVPQIAQAEASLLPRIRGLIFFMVALILILTTLCVFASMAALAMERRRDVGLMKAIGGSISRIVRIFFTEAAALGLAGALIGYVAGIFLSRWIGERAFHVAISARPEVLPIVVALMVLVSLAGALPLRLLGRVRPAEILRGE